MITELGPIPLAWSLNRFLNRSLKSFAGPFASALAPVTKKSQENQKKILRPESESECKYACDSVSESK